MVEKHKIAQLYTAPTAIRLLMKQGESSLSLPLHDLRVC